MPILMRMVVIAAMTLPAGAGYADGLMVDPSKVKPEYRAAAEKRAAEQKKLIACQKDADAKKLLPRDRTKFLTDCLDK